MVVSWRIVLRWHDLWLHVTSYDVMTYWNSPKVGPKRPQKPASSLRLGTANGTSSFHVRDAHCTDMANTTMSTRGKGIPTWLHHTNDALVKVKTVKSITMLADAYFAKCLFKVSFVSIIPLHRQWSVCAVFSAFLGTLQSLSIFASFPGGSDISANCSCKHFTFGGCKVYWESPVSDGLANSDYILQWFEIRLRDNPPAVEVHLSQQNEIEQCSANPETPVASNRSLQDLKKGKKVPDVVPYCWKPVGPIVQTLVFPSHQGTTSRAVWCLAVSEVIVSSTFPARNCPWQKC